MEFDNTFEDEKCFPYLYISLEESRKIRYLIRNMDTFKNGEVVQMSLQNNGEYVYGNGMFASDDGNKTFESYVYKTPYGYKIFSVIEEVLKHKDYYSVDVFLFEEKDIRVISEVEHGDKVVKKIDYPEESFTRK